MDTLELPVVEPASVTWYRIDERRYRWAPQDRPPAAARAFVGLLGVGSMLTAAALLLSDRAPGAVQTVFGDRARDLWQRIDATERVNLPAGSEIPPTDFVAHIAIWAVVTALIGLAIWTWRGLAIGIAALAGGSLLLELAQGRYASTRTVQAADALANLIGVSLGAAAAGICYLTWSAGAALMRALRPSHGRPHHV